MTVSPTVQEPIDQRTATAAWVAAGAAVLFGIAMFLTVASVNVPHDASDTELLDWWQQSGNRRSGMFSGLLAMSAAALFAVVANHVHRLAATRTSPSWRAFARSMGAAFTAAMVVTAATRSAVGHLVDVMGEPLPSVDVLRFATALNYQVLGLSAMGALGLAVLTTSVLALRTSAFARWAGWVGVGCGTLMTGAVAAGYGGFTVPLAILWSFCLAAATRPRRRVAR
ncbi:hypothetical protein [Nocardioides halotolerans]|uniref:hypothetical protein n=1 Tax=Nocardioides halotolerans TaxID=433660 RepID=UPI000417CF24|nr:hypothetical protein [Nocardioides halotolerans]